jgi:hypothetical protein
MKGQEHAGNPGLSREKSGPKTADEGAL